jgi:hypothetical protein
MRVESLSDEEAKVIDAIRLIASTRQQMRESAAQSDMRSELEGIFRELDNIRSEFWEETVHDIRDRIYNLLY